MFSIFISIKTSVLTFCLAFGCGLALLLSVICLQKKQSLNSNNIVVSLDMNNQINTKTERSNSLKKFNESMAISQVTNELKSVNSSGQNRPVVAIKKVDFTNVNSKYLNINNANNPLFTNYLVKSNRPFLGY